MTDHLLARLDTELLTGIRTFPHTPTLDRVAKSFSAVADHCLGWFVIGTVGMLLDHDDKDRWARATAATAATEQLSRAIKRRVERPRPHLDGLPPLAPVTSAGSFPSSHAATAAAAISAYQGLLPRPALIGWCALTALSRPYLGVHYPSDVLAGLALGAVCGRVARVIYESGPNT